ncbi:MAG: hypothetical protein JNM84_21585 [Planctomycetes bacterium]|nr:hypothetical protein [Planctomycetota bacterium]
MLVLWEDSRSASGEFGPHELLCSLVADDRGASVYDVRRALNSVTLNGVSNLLKSARSLQRFKRQAPGAELVLAIFDEDKIRLELKLVPTASDAEIEAAVRAQCDQPERLKVVLLHRNAESVIRASKECDERSQLRSDLLQDALEKDLNARDALLARIARDSSLRALRDCIRRRIPALDRAVRIALQAAG